MLYVYVAIEIQLASNPCVLPAVCVGGGYLNLGVRVGFVNFSCLASTFLSETFF